MTSPRASLRLAAPGVLLAALALLGGHVPSATAQPAPWQPVRDTAGWTITPGLGLGGLWDSNATLRATGDPQLREWVGVVNPRGEIDYNGRRGRLNLGYSGGLEAYRNLSELTRYDQRGRADGRYQMSPRLQLMARSALTVSPTTERLELGSLPFENIGSTLLTTRGGFEVAATPRTRMTAEYEFQWVQFDRSNPRFASLSGGHSNGLSATLSHDLGEHLRLSGAWTGRLIPTNGGLDNARIQDGSGLLTWQVDSRTTILAGAGLAHLQIVETGETSTGPSLRAGLARGLPGQVTVTADFERSYVPSWGFGGTTTNEEVRGGVHVPMRQGRLTLDGGVAWRHNEPLLSTPGRIQLDSWWTGASVGYGIARWVRVEAFYTGSIQTSSARGQIDRTRVGVQFVTSKPMRLP